MFSFANNLVNQALGQSRQAELNQIKLTINNQIQTLRQKISQENALSEPAKTSLVNQLQEYEKNHAQQILTLGNGVLDFRVDPQEWGRITILANKLEAEYEKVLLSYNAALTVALSSDINILPAIFMVKRSLYPLLCTLARGQALKNDTELLLAKNKELTQKANQLFEDKSKTDKQALKQLLALKKCIAQNLHRLAKPSNNLTDEYFQPLNQAIDLLINFLIGEKGPYLNKEESKNFFGFISISRADKFSAALNYCDRLVTGSKLESLATPEKALTEGELSTVVNQSRVYMNQFFGVSLSAPLQMLLLGPRPQSLALEGQFDLLPDFSATLLPRLTSSSDFASIVNLILKDSIAVMMVPDSGTILESLRNNLVKKINEMNAAQKVTSSDRSDLLFNLGQLLALSPSYQDGEIHMGKLCVLQKALASEVYENNPPVSVIHFVQALTVYTSDKYKDLQKSSSADRTKLEAALLCFQILIKDNAPENTLASHSNSSLLNGAFTRQGNFKGLVAEFIRERNEEKNAELKKNSGVEGKVFANQQKRENKMY